MSTYESEILVDPAFLSGESYEAIWFRKWFADMVSAGTLATGDFALTLAGGMNYQIAGGIAYVYGQNVADQGAYREYETAAKTLTVPAAHATLPRLDQVILRVMDTAHDSSTYREARIEHIPGTATSGATLDNRSGAANLATLTQSSKSVLLLHDILVPAAAGSIVAGNVRDKRVRARVGHGNMLGPDTNIAVATAVAGLPTAQGGKPVVFRVGTSPFDFVTLIYDSTLLKWVSSEVTWQTTDLDNAAGTDALWSGVPLVADMQIPNFKAHYDAGLRLQVRCAGRGSGAAQAWNYKLRADQYNTGDTSLSTVATSGALISGSAANENRVGAWTDLAVVPTENHLVLRPLFTFPGNSSSKGVCFGYRWVI
jgi:hypothetical protein